MSRGNRGVGVVIGGGIAVGLALAILYATVIRPSGQRGDVRQEIGAWSGAWMLARRCLTGEPRSTDAIEAIAARELTSAQALASMRRCGPKLNQLPRKPGFDSESDAIEAAWAEQGEAVRKLATAFALHTAKERQSKDPSALRAQLGAAVAAIDTAHAALRNAADMDKSATDGAGRLRSARRPAEVQPGFKIDLVDVAANVVMAQGTLPDGSEVMLRLAATPPRPDQMRPLDPLVTIAASDTKWGIATVQEQDVPVMQVATALDDLGQPTGPAVTLVKIGPDTLVSRLFALGDGAHRVALLQAGPDADAPDELRLARSSDSGATWTIEVFPGARPIIDYARRRAHVTWEEEGLVQWLELHPDRLDTARPRLLAPSNLITAAKPEPCAGSDAVWWDLGDIMLYSAGGNTPRPVQDSWLTDGAGLTICDDHYLVSLIAPTADANGLQVVSCSSAGCSKLATLPLPDGSIALATIGPKHGIVIAVHAPPVLAVWEGSGGSELKLTDVVRVDVPERLIGVVEWDGEIYPVERSGDSLRVISLR